MFLAPPKEGPVRILALFPHPRQTGHVVLGEKGLVPGSFVSSDTRRAPTLERRVASIERLIAASVARHRPHVIAIVRVRGCAWVEAITKAAIAAARATGRPLHVREERELHEIFADPATTGYDRLGQTITRGFFPELAATVPSWRRGGEEARRRMRPVWKAAAVAIAALGKIRPAAVTTLATEPIPAGLASLIDRASRPPV